MGYDVQVLQGRSGLFVCGSVDRFSFTVVFLFSSFGCWGSLAWGHVTVCTVGARSTADV